MLQFSKLAFFSNRSVNLNKVLRFPEQISTYTSDSNSVILSLASYLTDKFPNLPHPSYLDLKLQNYQKPLTSFTPSTINTHPLYQAWCDSFCKAVLDGHAYRYQDTLYIAVKVDQDYFNRLPNLGFTLQLYTQQIDLKRIFSLDSLQQQNQKKKKKIFLINFAISQLKTNQLLPKIHVAGLIIGTLFNNQQWSLFCVLKGQFPTKSQLLQADTVILPGSSNSVLSKIQQVDTFSSSLFQAFNQTSKLKLLCICYGHQLISKIFESKIVKKTRYQGHQIIMFYSQIISKYKFLHHILEHNLSNWLLSEYHQDYVQTLPAGFDLLADSNSCHVQAMVKQDGRILSFQFHPEYTSEYTIAFTNRQKYARTKHLDNFAYGIQTNEQLNQHHQSCKYLRLCMKQFIQSQPDII